MLSLLSGLEQRQTVNKTKQFPSTKAEREQSIIGPWEPGRQAERQAVPGLENGQKALVCCWGSWFNLLQQGGKKKCEGRFKHCPSVWRLLGRRRLSAQRRLVVKLQTETRREIKNKRKKERVALVFVSALFFFYIKAPAWRGWLGSFVAAQCARKSMFQTPRRIFKGTLGNIFPALLYKMTTVYYSCRAWWGCWSIPVTQQLLCQLLRFLPFNIHSLCNLKTFPIFLAQQCERAVPLDCANAVTTHFIWGMYG